MSDEELTHRAHLESDESLVTPSSPSRLAVWAAVIGGTGIALAIVPLIFIWFAF